MATLLPDDGRGQLSGVRVAVVDDDVVRVEALARALRVHGALVEVSDFTPSESRFRTLRSFDPIVLIADEAKLVDRGGVLVHRVRDDVVMRWAQWLSSDWTPVWSDGQRHADVSSWVGPIRGFAENEKQLARRIRRREAFRFNINEIGPTRVLRRMARATGITLARFDAGPVEGEVELSDGRVSGASTTHHKKGTDALAEILTWQNGVVEISFPNQLGHGELMLRAAEAFDEAVIRLLDSEEESTTRGDYAEAVAEAVAAARGRMPPALGSDFEDAKDSTPVGTSHGVQEETQPPMRRLQARRRNLIVFGATALAAAALTVGGYWLLHEPKIETHQAPQAIAHAVEQVPAKPPVDEPSAPVVEKREANAAPTVEAEPHAADAEGKDQKGSHCDSLSLDPPTVGGERGAGISVKQGRQALMAGNVKLAERHYCQAVVLAPSGPMYEQLAKFYIEHGDAKQGTYWANRALERRPGSLEARLLKIDASIAEGPAVGAQEELFGVLSISEKPSARKDRVRINYTTLGAKTLRGSDAGQAARFYRRAILVDPKHPEAHAGLARTLLMQDDPDGALVSANRAIAYSKRFKPKTRASYYLVQGDAYERLGDTKAAAEAWSQALSLDARNQGARERLTRRE